MTPKSKKDTLALDAWWRDDTEVELAGVMPKAIEYGSSDLRLMGQAMLMFMPQCEGKVDAEELAIAFYALGKTARLIGAYVDGRVPSEDTWHDLAVYAKMAKRVRAVGQWPGPTA